MWKIAVILFAIIIFIALILVAISWIRDYTEEKNKTSSKEKEKFKDLDPQSIEVVQTMDSFTEYLGAIQKGPLNDHDRNNSDQLFAVVGDNETVVKRLRDILYKFPHKTSEFFDITTYLIPLTKKLLDDYKFYVRQGSAIADKNKMKCLEGLEVINKMLIRKADSMIEDKYIDLHADVEVLMNLYGDNSSQM